MKTIIIYESKHGFTKKIAEYLSKKLNVEARLVKDINNIENYENIIIATPVYVGTINKKIKSFILGNIDILFEKNVYIYISAMNIKEYDKMLNYNFTKEMLDKFNISYSGGAYYLEKMNWLEKFALKKIAGITENKEEIKYSELDKSLIQL